MKSPPSSRLCYLSFDLSSKSWASTHALFPFWLALYCCDIRNISTWALARKLYSLQLLTPLRNPLEQLLKGSSAVADERGQNVSHSIPVLSDDWDPADQSHKQITINKLNGESWRLGVFENNDARQAFKKKRHLIINSNQLTAPSNHLLGGFMQGWEGHRSLNLFIIHVPCYQLVRCFMSLSNWIPVCACVCETKYVCLFRQAALFCIRRVRVVTRGMTGQSAGATMWHTHFIPNTRNSDFYIQLPVGCTFS